MSATNSYGDAFKAAKEARGQGKTDEPQKATKQAEGIAAERHADGLALRILEDELRTAAQQVKQFGGEISTGGSWSAEGDRLPTVVSFRVFDNKGATSPVYDIVTHSGPLTVFRNPCGTGAGRTDISREVGIQHRDDITPDSARRLIMQAIEEYRNYPTHRR